MSKNTIFQLLANKFLIKILKQPKINLIFTAGATYVFYKGLKFTFDLFILNYNLRHIPVTSAFPLKLGGYYQPVQGYSRWERFNMIYEASAKSGAHGVQMPKEFRCPPGITKIYFLPFYPIVFISSSDAIKSILKSTKIVNKTTRLSNVINDTFGENILVQKKEQWKEKRRLLVKTMHKDLHQEYGSVINLHVADMVREIKETIRNSGTPKSSSSSSKSAIIDYGSIEYDLSLSILAENIFGQKLTNPTQKAKFINLYETLNKYMELRLIKPGLDRPGLFKIYCKVKKLNFYELKDEFRRMIIGMVESRNKMNVESSAVKEKRPKLLIDILLDLYHQKILSFDEIINESSIFFLAALDTTSITMNGAIYGLSHPKSSHIQEKLIEEIDRFFPDKNVDLNVQPEILSEMVYLDAVVRESLRFYGPVPFISRLATSGDAESVDFYEADVTTEPFKINIGNWPITLVLQLRQASHELIQKNALRNNKPETSDPNTFRPERFLNNEIDLSDLCAYSPFSRGVRDCIGKPMALISMKVQLIQIYKNFRTEIFVRDVEDEEIDRKREFDFLLKFAVKPLIKFSER